MLYKEECYFRKSVNPSTIWPCQEWGLAPISRSDDGGVVVCKKHQSCAIEPVYVYPGPTIAMVNGLNYRERSALSPVKIMSQITRKRAITSGRVGHYELAGSLWMRHNYEFAQMMYEGTLGMFYQDGVPGQLRPRRIKQVWDKLVQCNPLLQVYKDPEVVEELVEYHLETHHHKVGAASGWRNKIVFPIEDIPPSATDEAFRVEGLRIGQDTRGDDVQFSHPSLMALMFPHLFTYGRGHYSMAQVTAENTALPEEYGGVAMATRDGETIKGYAKRCLLLADRRFARDPSFLFFMLDAIEKHNISSYRRRVVNTRGRGAIQQQDVVSVDPGTGVPEIRQDRTSGVPHIIRSSYAYKRKAYLDMACLFDKLGEPQVYYIKKREQM
ncbi:uncharacterized protein BYT42DRAFT_506498 [Radiomyces spectabilis]|uniref:uncharacterized protein n=1 Tax=Radiomyces spectabilis TaxID=64574 RepID=UPI00221FC425|nr:uncharacterized protein BYT42DRAFT_506498 [Radiomyces spectabilis]KAI8364142.1 hypothetical protein BYT42DRAFT_506498 [Radiomyces spectabilis]